MFPCPLLSSLFVRDIVLVCACVSLPLILARHGVLRLPGPVHAAAGLPGHGRILPRRNHVSEGQPSMPRHHSHRRTFSRKLDVHAFVPPASETACLVDRPLHSLPSPLMASHW